MQAVIRALRGASLSRRQGCRGDNLSLICWCRSERSETGQWDSLSSHLREVFRLNHACLTGHRPRSPTLMGRQLITFFSFFFFFIPCALSIWPVRALLNQSKSPLHRWLIRNAKSQNPSSWSLLLQSFLNWQQPARAQNRACGADCVSERERWEDAERWGGSLLSVGIGVHHIGWTYTLKCMHTENTQIWLCMFSWVLLWLLLCMGSQSVHVKTITITTKIILISFKIF